MPKEAVFTMKLESELRTGKGKLNDEIEIEFARRCKVAKESIGSESIDH